MKTSTQRVEIFSDGVMAILITIMVIELKLPELDESQGEYEIKNHIIELFPYFGAYIFSFTMIAILWTHHHHLFNLLETTDNILLGQNFFFLFWLSLIPFVTGMIGANPLIPLSTALYGFIMLMTTLFISLMRNHAINNKLLHVDEDKEITKKMYQVFNRGKVRTYISSAAYLGSVVFAFFSVYASYFLFIIPVVLFLWPIGIDEEKIESKVIEKNSQL